MDVGILGGTGPAGRALAARLAMGGLAVVLGSRQAERAEQVAAELCSRWPRRSLQVRGAGNAGAAAAGLVVVATPWDAAGPTAAELASQLEGKVVVSMANALVKVGRELQPLVVPRGSVAQSVAAAAPGARVAAAFHHLPARELADLDQAVEGDVLVCSDDGEALRATLELVGRMPELRGLEAGTLASAAPVEGFTAVLLSLNMRYRARCSLRVIGVAP